MTLSDFPLFFKYSKQDKRLAYSIKRIFGFYPKNIILYKIALSHKSRKGIIIKGREVNNERLEYLGDSVLNLVIAYFLFKRYPLQSEGFLTEMRSRMVCRSRLNDLSIDLGISNLMDSEHHIPNNSSINGNALEAIMGAIYIDKGYKFCYSLFVKNIIPFYFDLNEIENNDTNYKSKIYRIAQKNKLDLDFVVKNEKNNVFEVNLLINGKNAGNGKDLTIKAAEQNAAKDALENNSILLLIDEEQQANFN